MKSAASSLLCVFLTFALLNARSKPESVWDSTTPAQWTSDDVYRILNRSPWTQSVKITFSKKGDESLSNQAPAANAGNRNYGPGPGAAGGRRGYNRSGSYGSGAGSAPPSNNPPVRPTEVTVQWQSALPVRIAAAKKAGESIDPASFKPLDEYVIAVIGLPSTAIGGRAASADTDPTINQQEQKRIEDHVKSAASIVRSGHEPLTASKVELDQGFDGRMLIHFAKQDPIAPGEKSVEFRLAGGHPSLKKKFELKEMEYQGKLQL